MVIWCSRCKVLVLVALFGILLMQSHALRLFSVTQSGEVTIIRTPTIARMSPSGGWTPFNATLVARSAPGSAKSGNVVLCDHDETISPEETGRRERQHNPAGLIIISYGEGEVGLLETTFQEMHDSTGVSIPTVTIGFDEGFNLLKKLKGGEEYIVEITQGEHNFWVDLYHVAAPFNLSFRIGLIVWSLFNACLAAYKLSQFPRPLTFSVGPVCLGVQLMANFVRLVWGVDPLFSDAHLFPWFVQNILLTLPWALNLISTMLITLYWKQLLSKKSLFSNAIMDNLQKPFLVLCAVSIIIDFTSSALRGVYLDVEVLRILHAGYYALLYLPLSIFFFYVGFRVRTALKDREHHYRRLRRITLMIVMSGCGNLLFLLSLVLILFPSIFWIPATNATCWSAATAATLFVSTMQIYVFQPRKNIVGSTTAGRSTSSGVQSKSAFTSSTKREQGAVTMHSVDVHDETVDSSHAGAMELSHGEETRTAHTASSLSRSVSR